MPRYLLVSAAEQPDTPGFPYLVTNPHATGRYVGVKALPPAPPEASKPGPVVPHRAATFAVVKETILDHAHLRAMAASTPPCLIIHAEKDIGSPWVPPTPDEVRGAFALAMEIGR